MPLERPNIDYTIVHDLIAKQFALEKERVDREYGSKWHLDRKMPVMIIFTFVAQLVFGVWWTSKLDSRVQSMEAMVPMRTEQIARLDAAREAAILHLSVLQDRTETILEIVRRIDNRVTPPHPP